MDDQLGDAILSRLGGQSSSVELKAGHTMRRHTVHEPARHIHTCTRLKDVSAKCSGLPALADQGSGASRISRYAQQVGRPFVLCGTRGRAHQAGDRRGKLSRPSPPGGL